MKILTKISTYGLILYLALMLCCVQNAYVHHGMHQHSAPAHHHSSQIENVDSSANLISVSSMGQAESTLFNNNFLFNLLLGFTLIFSLFFLIKYLSLTDSLISYIRRRKRRWRNLLLTSSFGLRSPPAYP